MVKIKKTFYLLLLLLILSGFTFEVYAFFVNLTEGKAPPSNLGNGERVISMLQKEKSEGFTFAVAGDTKSHGVFEQIAEKFKGENFSFFVLLGDCAFRGTPEEHRYLWAELEEMPITYPLFYIVGNHDIGPSFPLKRFEEIYGPTNFSFLYKSYLFIGLRVLPAPFSSEETLSFLEKTLLLHRKSCKGVFVFMHIPPSLYKDWKVRRFKDADKFIELFERYQVDYVICGDYHGYGHLRKGSTVYILTGGGGARIKAKKYGAFHHALVFRITPQGICEELLIVNGRTDIEDVFEHAAMAGFLPWVKERPFLTGLINAGAILFGVVLSRGLKREG